MTGTRRFGHAVRCENDTWTPSSAKLTRRWTLDGVDAGAARHLRADHGRERRARDRLHRDGDGERHDDAGADDVPAAAGAVSTFLPFIEVPAGGLPWPAISRPATPATGPGRRRTSRSAGSASARRARLGTGPTFTLGLGQNGVQNSVRCEVVASNDGGRVGGGAVGQQRRARHRADGRDRHCEQAGGSDGLYGRLLPVVDRRRRGRHASSAASTALPFIACIGTLAQTYHNLSISDPRRRSHTFSVQGHEPGVARRPTRTRGRSGTWSRTSPSRRRQGIRSLGRSF